MDRHENVKITLGENIWIKLHFSWYIDVVEEMTCAISVSLNVNANSQVNIAQ